MPQPILFCFLGESNSGGFAENSDALTAEKGDRVSVKILNNTTLSSFDTLHISSIGDGFDNTHVGHVAFENFGAVHGWELQIANRADTNEFSPSAVRLVKCGQGGSKISHWQVGATITANGNTVSPWGAFIARTDAAISLLTSEFGIAPRMVFLFSLGINDAIDGVSASTWKTNTKELRQRIRTRYGNVPLLMTRFDSMFGVSMTAYNTVIDQIGTEEADTYVINSVGLGMKSDGNHWNYAGMKSMANKMVDKFLSLSSTTPTDPVVEGLIELRGVIFNIINPPTIPNISLAGKQQFFIGDSITAGLFAQDGAHRWTTLFVSAVDAIEDNKGVSGMVLQPGTSGQNPYYSSTVVPTKSSDEQFIFFNLGTNDVGMNNGTMTPSAFQTLLNNFVSDAISKGWAASNIVIGTPYWFTNYSIYTSYSGVTAANVTRHEQYVAACIAVAQARHCVIADVYTAMKNASNNSTFLYVDGLHPNNVGHAFIANFYTHLNYTPA